MKRSSSSSSNLHRNEVEKQRRKKMNHLYSHLSSLIPNLFPLQEKKTLGIMLDQATDYVVQLKQNVEELKQRKALLEGHVDDQKENSISPVLTLREMGSTLEVNLITGVENNFKLHQALIILEEEGLEALSACYSIVDNKIFYTIDTQVVHARIGVETSRVYERLKEIV